MKKIRARWNVRLLAILITLVTQSAYADVVSDVWTTGVTGGAAGSFGTPGSISGSTLDARIATAGNVANVSLTSSNAGWFRTTGSVTNDELAPFFENAVSTATVAFSSDQPLEGFDMLFHNVLFDGTGQNFVGNFEVTYEDGTVVSNAQPLVRAINADSPFSITVDGAEIHPTGLNPAFDSSDVLAVSAANFDPSSGGGATPGYYLFDETIITGNPHFQGSGIVSFDESLGGITRVEFDWLGNTTGSNTAFIGFAGKATAPEPSSAILVLMASLGGLRVRKRRAEPAA